MCRCEQILLALWQHHHLVKGHISAHKNSTVECNHLRYTSVCKMTMKVFKYYRFNLCSITTTVRQLAQKLLGRCETGTQEIEMRRKPEYERHSGGRCWPACNHTGGTEAVGTHYILHTHIALTFFCPFLANHPKELNKLHP